jgi:SAM-dependent methyltransferase
LACYTSFGVIYTGLVALIICDQASHNPEDIAGGAKLVKADANSYPGVDQLRAMVEADNYNASLVALITDSCGREERLLDYGAGIGFFAKKLQALGYRVDCLEPDRALGNELTEAGFSVLPSLGPESKVHFDTIYSFNVLEHIEDDQAVLHSMSAALRPGGQLILYVPAFQILFSSMDRLVGHRRRYRLNGLKAKVQSAGFEIERALYTDSLGFFVALLYRLADPGNGAINIKVLRVYDRFIFPMSKALDLVCRSFFGKNIALRATRKAD